MAVKRTSRPSKPKLDPGLLKAHKAYEAAINSNKVDRVMAMYDKDAAQVPPGAPATNGWAELRKAVEDYFSTYKTTWTKVPVQNWVCGDYGFDFGHDTAVDIPRAKGQPTIFWNCQGILIYKRQKNGSWLVYRDIWNNISDPTYMLPHTKK
jgi:ketosteroid isomerase-like protein